MGANIAANGSREQMSYTIDCLRSHMPAALELLSDCVINPAFLPHEIEEQKARMQLLLSLPDVQLTLLSEVRRLLLLLLLLWSRSNTAALGE
jgi:processing peptidase subunit alpha